MHRKLLTLDQRRSRKQAGFGSGLEIERDRERERERGGVHAVALYCRDNVCISCFKFL